VTFCDINEEKGKALEAELGTNVTFVKCDTRSWEDQIQLFETACSNSPHKSVDIVIANAGVGRGAGDPLMQLEGEECP
jgi:NAD(P)-dependent dehydrogenase (short-subunit alcohol dehydrogenase family)